MPLPQWPFFPDEWISVTQRSAVIPRERHLPPGRWQALGSHISKNLCWREHMWIPLGILKATYDTNMPHYPLLVSLWQAVESYSGIIWCHLSTNHKYYGGDWDNDTIGAIFVYSLQSELASYPFYANKQTKKGIHMCQSLTGIGGNWPNYAYFVFYPMGKCPMTNKSLGSKCLMAELFFSPLPSSKFIFRTECHRASFYSQKQDNWSAVIKLV